MSIDGQGTLWRRNIGENFNRLSRVHQRYRQTTDDRQTDGPSMTYSEHELEFTFANKLFLLHFYNKTDMSCVAQFGVILIVASDY